MPDNIKKKRGLKGDWSYRLTPFENKLLGDVLEDLGYKNTKEARIALYESGALFWD